MGVVLEIDESCGSNNESCEKKKKKEVGKKKKKEREREGEERCERQQ